jgi:hypothetical protein
MRLFGLGLPLLCIGEEHSPGGSDFQDTAEFWHTYQSAAQCDCKYDLHTETEQKKVEFSKRESSKQRDAHYDAALELLRAAPGSAPHCTSHASCDIGEFCSIGATVGCSSCFLCGDQSAVDHTCPEKCDKFTETLGQVYHSGYWDSLISEQVLQLPLPLPATVPPYYS